MNKKLVITEDGSHTIFVPKLNEHYHSMHGAVQESEHIFINYGFNFSKADPVRIFEIGFGTGLNALLTAARSMEGNREVFYTAIEKYPVESELVEMLNYIGFAGENGEKLFSLINEAPWGETRRICKNFSICKLQGDLVTDSIAGDYDLVYFDAFGPDKQPEMWSAEIFNKIGALTVVGGVLVTYSSKGEVRRNLEASGFEVTRLPGPPGKRQIIRAIKI